ncbi:hypothetical protein [Candidatus Nitrospira bockiana]
MRPRRPTARRQKRRKVVCIDIDEDLAAQARAEGLSIGDVVRRAIDEMIEEDEKHDADPGSTDA